MAKVFGLQGYLTGKLGATVFAIRNGEQIGRQYNPVVSNPKTDAQVANRAKLKLLSQLSASVAPVIAMPRSGMVSTRNLFTKHNYEYTSYGNSEASIPMADILLTASYTAMPGIHVERSGSAVHANLLERADSQWDKVCYVILKKGDTGAIAPATSLVVSNAGTDGLFPVDLPYVGGDISVHCYGIRLNTQYSRVIFGNITAPRAEDVAKIVTSRTFNEGDMSLSETRGCFLDTNENVAESSGVSTVAVNGIAYDMTSNARNVGGTITGGGRVELNSSVVLTAEAAEDYTFVGWANNPDDDVFDTASSITVVANAAKTLYAMFRASHVIINGVAFNRSENTEGGGTVTGGGTVNYGSSVTLSATAAEGKVFVGWAGTPNGTIVSTRNTFTVNAVANTTIYAIFDAPVATYTVTPALATGVNSAMGSVSGGGQIVQGHTATVIASAASGYQFGGWYTSANPTGNAVSKNASYTFTPSANTTLYANFVDMGMGGDD